MCMLHSTAFQNRAAFGAVDMLLGGVAGVCRPVAFDMVLRLGLGRVGAAAGRAGARMLCAVAFVNLPVAPGVCVLIFERHPHTDGFQLCICGHGEGQRAVVHIFNASLGAAPFQRIAFLGGGRHGGARFAGLHLLRQRARQRAAVFAVLDGERDGHALGFGAGRAGAAGRRLRVEGLLRRGRVRGDGGQRRAAVLGLVGVRAHIVDQRFGALLIQMQAVLDHIRSSGKARGGVLQGLAAVQEPVAVLLGKVRQSFVEFVDGLLRGGRARARLRHGRYGVDDDVRVGPFLFDGLQSAAVLVFECVRSGIGVVGAVCDDDAPGLHHGDGLGVLVTCWMPMPTALRLFCHVVRP